jgi:hypothetical protein
MRARWSWLTLDVRKIIKGRCTVIPTLVASAWAWRYASIATARAWRSWNLAGVTGSPLNEIPFAGGVGGGVAACAAGTTTTSATSIARMARMRDNQDPLIVDR